MSSDERRAVRENAQYLRRVRPIDPAEIADYVEGRPHPAVVRRLLREEAFDLGLVERADGLFVPVSEEPFDPTFRGVEALPDAYADRLDDLLVERWGPDWFRGESGAHLRETIRRLKADYFRQHPVEYDADVALAYAVYHLPDYYAGVQYVVDDLGRAGLLGHRLRVLDVGAGVGGPALGLHDYLGGDALVAYHAVEPSAAADVLATMLDGTGPNFHHRLHRETAEAFDPGTLRGTARRAQAGDGDDGGVEFDLVLFSNVLSELDDPVAVVRRYAEFLADDGTLVLVEPADRNTSITLRAVERAVEDGLTVWGPTVRLWPGERPTDRGWSFTRKPDLAVPPFQRRLADGATDPAAFVNVTVQYSYSLLRADGRRRIDRRADPRRHAKMAEMESHVTDRVDLLAAKLSHDLADDGHPLFAVSDGSEAVSHYAVVVRETALNEPLVRADFGDLLAFENVLVLWNDDEGAYNLVVDERTVVDRVA